MTWAERQKAINEAMTWIGTPYQHEARVKGAGVDCGQFLAAVYYNAGLLPEVTVDHYPHDWHLHRSEERYLNIVGQHSFPDNKKRPGDIALFRFGRCLSHGAIIIEWPTIIHSYIGRGVVLDNVETNSELNKRFAGTWTLKRWIQ
jgi:cell wall-associated NlpC family hydrolase